MIERLRWWLIWHLLGNRAIFANLEITSGRGLAAIVLEMGRGLRNIDVNGLRYRFVAPTSCEIEGGLTIRGGSCSKGSLGE